MKIPFSIVFNYFYCTHSVKSTTNTCSHGHVIQFAKDSMTVARGSSVSFTMQCLYMKQKIPEVRPPRTIELMTSQAYTKAQVRQS